MDGNGRYELIQAAGGLLWRKNEDRQEILLIRREDHGGWDLPYGMVASGERVEQIALREVTKVAEERGYMAILVDFAGDVFSYEGNCSRIVHYWNMQAEAKVPAAKAGSRPPDEEENIKWLPVTEALRLIPEEERELLKQQALHAMDGFGEYKPAFRPFPLLQPSRWYDRLFVDPSLDRLRNFLESYYQEMWHLEAVTIDRKVPGFHHHFQAMARLLKVSREALRHGDVDYGWGAYNTAHRIETLIYFKMMSDGRVRVLQEYAAAMYRGRANDLLTEGQGKLSGWRLARMQKLICDKNKQLKDHIPVADILLAQKNMSDHFENTYLRLKIISRQIRILEIIAVGALVTWIGLLQYTKMFEESQVTSTLSLSVLALIFGTLGACISGILRLEKRPVNKRIPGQLESKVFMLARPLVGVVFFVLSGIVTIGQDSAWLYMSAAFAAGFSERLLQFSVDQVAGEEGAEKKE